MDQSIQTMQNKFMQAYRPGVQATAIPWQIILQTILSLLGGCTAPQIKRNANGPLRRFVMKMRLAGAFANIDPFGDEDEAMLRAEAAMKVLDGSTEAEIETFKSSLRTAFPGVPS